MLFWMYKYNLTRCQVEEKKRGSSENSTGWQFERPEANTSGLAHSLTKSPRFGSGYDGDLQSISLWFPGFLPLSPRLSLFILGSEIPSVR